MCGIGQGLLYNPYSSNAIVSFQSSTAVQNQGLSVSHMLKPDVNIAVCEFAMQDCSEQSNNISGEDTVQGTALGRVSSTAPCQSSNKSFL